MTEIRQTKQKRNMAIHTNTNTQINKAYKWTNIPLGPGLREEATSSNTTSNKEFRLGLRYNLHKLNDKETIVHLYLTIFMTKL